jgi:hypothetical protein
MIPIEGMKLMGGEERKRSVYNTQNSRAIY